MSDADDMRVPPQATQEPLETPEPQQPQARETPAPMGVWYSFRFAVSSPKRLRTELLAGAAVSFALIPEVISFSILAGVDPAVGLFSSVILAMVIAFTGGRPAMITAAAGSVALVVAPLSRTYGMDYLIPTVLLAGVLQIAFAALGIAKLQRFIPRAVMIGFVNALGILIFTAQLEHLLDVPWLVYPLVALGIAIMVFLPRVFTAIPAPLVTVLVVTLVAVVADWRVPNVSDMGELPESLPQLLIPNVPLTWETLWLIAPYSVGVAIVGIMESLMTAKLVDDITDTHSDKTRETWGLGVANIAGGFFGGIAGCAMIGQTMVGVKESSGRTRLTTLFSGVFLLILVLLLSSAVGVIPMAALVAVMVVVSADTVDWRSISPRTLRLMPRSETVVMLVTVIATLATDNLAIGVVSGVVVASLMFARRVAHLVRIEVLDDDPSAHSRTYKVRGQLFFASSNDLVYQFDYTDPAQRIVIDMSEAEIWDASTVAALDSVRVKFADRGKEVEIVGLEGPSKQRLDALSGKL